MNWNAKARPNLPLNLHVQVLVRTAGVFKQDCILAAQSVTQDVAESLLTTFVREVSRSQVYGEAERVRIVCSAVSPVGGGRDEEIVREWLYELTQRLKDVEEFFGEDKLDFVLGRRA